jgi:hypothetical protein
MPFHRVRGRVEVETCSQCDISVGRHLPPFTEVVTPRPRTLGHARNSELAALYLPKNTHRNTRRMQDSLMHTPLTSRAERRIVYDLVLSDGLTNQSDDRKDYRRCDGG